MLLGLKVPGGFIRRDIDLFIAWGLCCFRFVTFALLLCSLFVASRHFLASSKVTSLMTLTEYLLSFKCRLKLENKPLRALDAVLE